MPRKFRKKAKKFYKKAPPKIKKESPQKKAHSEPVLLAPGRDLILLSSRLRRALTLFSGTIRRLHVGFFIQIFCLVSIIGLTCILIYYTSAIPRYNLKKINTKTTVHPYPYLDHDPDVYLSAQAYLVYSKDSRVTIFAKNENFRFAPASSAKIMTALISLSYYPLHRVLTVKNIHDVVGSKMGLVEGEKITVENLLYGLMLPSGNDAAYTLALNYPGGVRGFVAAMNRKTRSLHLLNTYFVDASGYEDNNYTTAYDLARLAAAALDNQEFRTIVATKRKTVSDVNHSAIHKLTNLNELLDIPGVIGVKTGFTEEAGGVLVTAFQDNGKTYIVTVLQSKERFVDSEELITKVIRDVKQFSGAKNSQ